MIELLQRLKTHQTAKLKGMQGQRLMIYYNSIGYLTFAARENVPLKTLQAIGGYADIYTLKNRYTHTQQEDVEHARQRIENMFSTGFCDTAVTTSQASKSL